MLYFIGKLQDVIFEGRDPKKLEVLKDFALELGFNETLIEGLERKNADDDLLNLFRNIRLIYLAQPVSQ